MASMRNALDVTHVPGVFSAALLGTQPALLVGILRRMGYRNVIDRITHRNLSAARRRPQLFEHDDAIMTMRLVNRIDQHGVMARTTRTAFEAEDVVSRRRGADTLREVEQLLQQRRFVILAIDPDILDHLDNMTRPRPNLSESQYLHYVAVTELTIMGDDVALRIFSWGRLYDGLMNLFDFSTHCFGYISARP